MPENDLDKYLEGIGIDVDDEQGFELPVSKQVEEAVLEPVPLSPMIVLEGSLQEKIETFLVNFLLNFDPSYSVDVKQISETEFRADIGGGNPGKIIGRNGNTLQALEYLCNVVINRQSDSDKGIRITVDVGGYKKRRDDKLRSIARKVADRVRREGKPFTLNPMNAAERRLVHIELADDESVESESTGYGKGRRVVIKPKQ